MVVLVNVIKPQGLEPLQFPTKFRSPSAYRLYDIWMTFSKLRRLRETEDLILVLRRELKEQSALGEFGAQAIHRALVARGHPAVPTVRTIGRVLERRGALDGRRRVRRLPPPRGWYLPAVGPGRAGQL